MRMHRDFIRTATRSHKCKVSISDMWCWVLLATEGADGEVTVNETWMSQSSLQKQVGHPITELVSHVTEDGYRHSVRRPIFGEFKIGEHTTCQILGRRLTMGPTRFQMAA